MSDKAKSTPEKKAAAASTPSKDEKKAATPAKDDKKAAASPAAKPAAAAAAAAPAAASPAKAAAPAAAAAKPAAAAPAKPAAAAPAAAKPAPAAAKPAAAKSAEKKKPEAPESRTQKRKATLSHAERVAKHKAALKQKKSKISQLAFKRAEKYVKEYRAKAVQEVRLRRAAREHGNIYAKPEAKVALVIRIRGIMNLHPRVRMILRLLRLRRVNNASFVRLTAATAQMLRLVEPYIAYGYPSLKTVRELCYKRGFAKIMSQRVPILDNLLIEKHLGKKGIVCMEDIIHEIYTCGPNFKSVNSFLYPFQLNPPRGGYSKVTQHFAEGGDAGNREEYINKLAQRMI